MAVASKSPRMPQDLDKEMELYEACNKSTLIKSKPLPSRGSYPSLSFKFGKKLFSLHRTKEIILDVKMKQETWTPGKYGGMTYSVKNFSDLDILSIKTELYCYRTEYNSKGRKTTEERVGLRDTTGQQWCLRIPPGKAMCASVQYFIPGDLRPSEVGEEAKKEYKFKVMMSLCLPHGKITVRIPLNICRDKDLKKTLLSENTEAVELSNRKSVKDVFMKYLFCGVVDEEKF